MYVDRGEDVVGDVVEVVVAVVNLDVDVVVAETEVGTAYRVLTKAPFAPDTVPQYGLQYELSSSSTRTSNSQNLLVSSLWLRAKSVTAQSDRGLFECKLGERIFTRLRAHQPITHILPQHNGIDPSIRREGRRTKSR